MLGRALSYSFKLNFFITHLKSEKHRPIRNNVTIKEKITKKYALIRRMEFNSERKRMSILVRDPDDGLIKLYCKGADSVILERLDSKLTDPDLQHETENFLQKASTNGLRTICLGMRILNETELNEFL